MKNIFYSSCKWISKKLNYINMRYQIDSSLINFLLSVLKVQIKICIIHFVLCIHLLVSFSKDKSLSNKVFLILYTLKDMYVFFYSCISYSVQDSFSNVNHIKKIVIIHKIVVI